MNKHIIIGQFGKQDDINVSEASGVTVTFLPLINDSQTLNYGIPDAIHHLYKLELYPSEIGLDLLIVAAHVYAADTRVLES